jgi:flagellin
VSVINSNISSLQAQASVRWSGLKLSSAMARLSSGVRINSAKDDAAGLAISTRMTASIRGISAAIRNANDGISITQTAEGSLAQISDNLQRVRELAVQSANTGNNASDRAAMNNEAGQLISEIDRVASNTRYNGIALLDGTFQEQSLQVGPGHDANDRISLNMASAKPSALGIGSGLSYQTSLLGGNVVAVNALANGDLYINGFAVGASSSDGVSAYNRSGSGVAKAKAINAISASTNVVATVSATTRSGVVPTSPTVAISVGDIRINSIDLGAMAASANALDRVNQVTAAVNAIASQTGITAVVSSTGVVALTAADGRNITVEVTANGSTGTGLGISGTATTSIRTSNTTEANTVSFHATALAANDSVTLGGLTFTSTGVTSAAQLVTAFANLRAGATAGNANLGSWSGTLTGFTTGTNAGGTVLYATSTTLNTGVTDLQVVSSVLTNQPTVTTVATGEVAVVSFNAGLRAGSTAVVDGLTFTATASLTSREVAEAFSNLAAGASTGSMTAKGIYSGSLTNFSTLASSGNTLTAVGVSGVSASVPNMSAILAGVTAQSYTSNLTLTSTAPEGITLSGAIGLTATGLTAGNTAATAVAGGGVSSLDLTTASGSQAALSTLDTAINTITDSRAAMGAYQNRLTASISNLETTSMNLSASRSRILDTDYAKETTNLAKSQIIQQAATAMLAQANQSGQSVLALLK